VRIALVTAALACLALAAAALAGNNEQYRITKADQARAVAAGATLGDVYAAFGSGWTWTPGKLDRSPSPSCGGYTPNLSPDVITGGTGATFKLGGTKVIGFQDAVYRTAAMAARDYAQVARRAYSSCWLGQLFAPKPTTISPLEVKAGTDSFAMRVQTQRSAGTAAGRLDYVLFVAGRSEAVLIIADSVDTPGAAAKAVGQETALARVLAHRLAVSTA
jgi:hypothetical protein